MELPTPRYRIERLTPGEGRGFRVTLIDHPQCFGIGSTAEEALRAARRAYYHDPHRAAASRAARPQS